MNKNFQFDVGAVTRLFGGVIRPPYTVWIQGRGVVTVIDSVWDPEIGGVFQVKYPDGSVGYGFSPA